MILDAETANFLIELKNMHKWNREAHKLTDYDVRIAAADKIDAAFEELHNRNYEDKYGVIAIESYTREKEYL